MLTRIPAGASSSANALVMPSTACLEAQYTVRLAAPTCPIWLETVTSDPRRRWAIMFCDAARSKK